ncbi:hypothetical protein [Anabaena sp. UHCC 0399]|uniref:hypothetical protein n=1 Tax=Anabaena sp. UHCC 0399 TaxID=3110238 RepID=UPI002B1E9A5B|nr:hypothetical protein [Anabaena sp. UHCC 0399]MEA5565691.1 hypothetical protein [Anabaena sp. UHCC 0399]
MQSQRMWLLISAELKVLSYEYYIGLTHNSALLTPHSAPAKRRATANSTQHSALLTHRLDNTSRAIAIVWSISSSV